MNHLPPKYDHIMINEKEEMYKGNVKIITPSKTYEIPRKYFVRVEDSIFGEAFIKEKKDELKWSHKNEKIQEFIINFLKSKGNVLLPIIFPEEFICDRTNIIKVLEEVGLYKYFEKTALGDNWIEITNLKSYYKDVLCNEELCNKTCTLYLRAINEALKATIYEGDFEITNKGRIALNGKDITKKVIPENEEAVDNTNLLINSCLYCDIDSYWNKILNGLLNMLFLCDNLVYNETYLLEKEKVCHLKNGSCCYQSTFHRHIKFNLVPYINYLMYKLTL